MPGISRVHGGVSAGGFYGLQPTVVKVANSAQFTADSVGAGGAITEGGYQGAVKALQTVASIVWLGARDADSFCAVVDGATFNTGAGATTNSTYGALLDALADNCGGAAGDYTVTVSTALNGAGTFTFA